jgi:molecular chaperone DnaK
MPKNNIVIGIDLGTTYSSVAYVNSHGKPEVIPNREGEYITPSVVLFDDDSPMVGTLAKRSAVGCPLNFCEFVKRQMGEKEWRFIAEDDQTYSAEEVSGILLSRLKEDAETFLQCEIKDAVITVPAYFNDAQRKATQDAGVIAGLNVRRIVNEPTAAALAYGLSKVDDNQTVMVYDLGGGTFDVTFLRINKEKIDVIATGGDKNLGGFDWDNCIMDYLNEAFLEKGGTDLFDDPSTTQDLRDKAEIAKKTLSSRDKTKIFVSASGKILSFRALSLKKFQRIF